MKKLSYLFIAFVLFACDRNEGESYSFDFHEPAIADGAENVSLRPLFHPGAGGGTDPDNYIYSYYCDTVNPPEHFMVSAKGRTNIMPPKSETLLPDTRYYWKCVANYNEHYGSSEVYSFTTIGLDKLNTRWRKDVICSVNAYETRRRANLHDYNTEVENDFLLGQAMNFTIDNDSIIQLRIYTGPWGNDPYYDGPFSFSADTVKIIGIKYEFVNFGEYEDHVQTLVLKKFDSDTLLVYVPND